MSKIINNETNYIYGKNPVKEALKIINKGVLFVQNNVTNPSIKELLDEAKTKKLFTIKLTKLNHTNKLEPI